MKRLILFPIFLSMCSFSFAGDLDDGIKLDEAINDDLKIEKNLQYIKRKALAKAQAQQSGEEGDPKVIVNTACGTGNQNFGAGANLKGATIVNLSNNTGANAVCGQ